MRCFVLAALLAAPAPAAAQQPETMSLLEKPLFAPPLSAAERSTREAELAQARTAYFKDRTNVDAVLALSRAQMQLGRVGDALETLTRAVEAKPDEPRLAVERGRGLIVIRKFEPAAREVSKAADAVPEAACVLGTARFLAGDYMAARAAFPKCPDPGVFAYLADHRAGSSAMPRPAISHEATRDPSPAIRLPGSPATKPGPAMRVSMAATYLDAAERLLKGDNAGAKELLKQIVEKDRNQWMDPVYIAAEADYARLLKTEKKKRKK